MYQNFNEAILLFKKEISFYYFKKAKLLLDSEYFEEAIQYFQKALDNDKSDAGIFYHKALALIELTRYEEAIQCFNEAMEINDETFLSHSSIFFFTKGYCLYRLNRFGEAIKNFNKTEDVDESDSQSFEWREKAFFKLNINRAA